MGDLDKTLKCISEHRISFLPWEIRLKNHWILVHSGKLRPTGLSYSLDFLFSFFKKIINF